jgi:hypothetical protein
MSSRRRQSWCAPHIKDIKNPNFGAKTERHRLFYSVVSSSRSKMPSLLSVSSRFTNTFFNHLLLPGTGRWSCAQNTLGTRKSQGVKGYERDYQAFLIKYIYEKNSQDNSITRQLSIEIHYGQGRPGRRGVIYAISMLSPGIALSPPYSLH